jgi:hypothetical protein
MSTDSGKVHPSKETNCGRVHPSIEDAIKHARSNLGGLDVEPFWGGMANVNPGRVVGYQVTARKRWRLDFDPKKVCMLTKKTSMLPYLSRRLFT